MNSQSKNRNSNINNFFSANGSFKVVEYNRTNQIRGDLITEYSRFREQN